MTTTTKKRRTTKPCRCGTTSKEQMDMILYEIRQNRKDIAELKSFMQKSKGTIGVIVFLIGILSTVFYILKYFK
tara:strand:- start:866 stop:1087 length:222 start_codon:yes stop_codon:yes gene_type:complete